MRELTTVADLREAAENDALLLWAAGGFGAGARAWTHGGAVAVAAPALSRRDRLAVRGPAPAAARLVRHALGVSGPSYRPVGDTALIAGLVTAVPALTVTNTFGWMDVAGPGLHTAGGTPTGPGLHTAGGTPTGPGPDTAGGTPTGPGPDTAGGAHWLGPDELPDAAELIADVYPGSYARPDGRHHEHRRHRWAGVRDDAGRLTAVAADAWSSPEVGFLAGVAAHPGHGRGRGHAEAACRLVLDTALRRGGRAALMVDADNPAAVRLYRRLGLRWRDVCAAGLTR